MFVLICVPTSACRSVVLILSVHVCALDRYPYLESLVSPGDRFGVLRRIVLDRLIAAPVHLAVFLPLVNAGRGYPGGSSMDVLSAGEMMAP